ncbi:MAG: SDR family oxidoreductase [Candidatus Hydrogenedentales bacterium]
MNEPKGAALITGASAGIGRELARQFAANGHDVILVARRADALRELARELKSDHGVRASAIALDLAEPDAPESLYRRVRQRKLQVDVLVNNAGVSVVRPFAEATLADHRRVLRINAEALTALTYLFLGPMRERGYGRILNVASIVSFFPTPHFAVYGATKAYVLSLTEALAAELRGSGVTVSALCPGFVDTDMVRAALADKSAIARWTSTVNSLDAAAVAREGYRACMSGKVVHLDRWSNEMLVQWLKLQPRWLVRRVGALFARFTE